ncbi:MAG: hypothetical protein CBB87_05765 [Micavibrio sp. TMED27]|nr:hypothetical protein [Micavibrio sp.]OUT91524.1 MAG: hypothetical protein CBB87_05765 [Micavibrio sp. TMED27]
MSKDTPQPIYPPAPPSVSPALKSQLDREVQKQITEQTEKFNKSYTPASDHAELKSDVKNLWRYVGALLTVIVLAATIYIHLDSKLTKLNETINSESKYIFDKYQNLENRVADDFRAMNARVDNLVIHSNNTEKNTKVKTETNKE